MFYDKKSEEPCNVFFSWSRKGGVLWAFFLEQKNLQRKFLFAAETFFSQYFLAIRETEAVIRAIQ